MAYPSRNINEAIAKAIEIVGKNFEYAPYTISYTKTRALIPQMLPPDHTLLTLFKQAVKELEKNGITDNNGRIVFFKGILRQMAQDLETKATEEHEKTDC